jgi:TonB family protein
MLWMLLIGAAVAAAQEPTPVPVTNPGTWISNADYPPAALRRRAQGFVGFRLSVDTAGVPTGCAISNSSQDRELDQATCDLLLARARFRPARDADGNAVAGSFASRVRWTIDESTFLVGLVPVRIVHSLTAHPGGLVVCDIGGDGRTPARGADFGCEVGYTHDQARRFASRYRGRIITLSDSVGYAPEPGPEPPSAGDSLGQLYARIDIRLAIAANGNVADCDVLRRSRTSGVAAPSPPDVCAYYRRNRQPMFASSPEPRAIRVRHEFYVRTSEFGDRPKE